MDDFNAELLKAYNEMPTKMQETHDRLKTWEDSAQDMADTHERLKGVTEEYHKEKYNLKEHMLSRCDPSSEFAYLADDRYILHGVLARLQATYGMGSKTTELVIEELINTLTSYLSQG